MDNDLELPSDLQIRMALIHNESLVQQIEVLKRLVVLHESELAILWCAVLVLGGSIIYADFRKDKQCQQMD